MKILGNTTEATSNVSEITLSDNNSLNDSGTVVSTQSAIKYYIDSVASGLDIKDTKFEIDHLEKIITTMEAVWGH